MTSAALIRRRRSSASLLSLYSALGIRPELAFDFANERYFTSRVPTTFSDAITHTRASTATYVDSSGVLQTAASGEPRLNHHVWDGSAWVNEGLLHESEARTNLITQSTSWLAWSQAGTATVLGQTITDNDAAAYAFKLLPVTIVSGQSYVFWVDIEKDNDETRFPAIGLDLGTDAAFYQLNTKTGAIAQRSATGTWSGDVVDMGSFWRLWIVGTSDSTSATAYLFPADGTTLGVTSAAATGSTTFLRAQLEAGSTPSSYIPTSGSAVTRAADVLTIPSANLPWNPLAVSIQMDGRVTYADTDQFAEVYFWRWFNDANNQTYANLRTNQSANGGRVNFWQIDAGVADNVVSSDVYTPGVLVPYNLASRNGSTFINGAVDGTALTVDTTPVALPDLETEDLELGFDYMGTIRTFRVWENDIGDTGIEEAST